METTMNPYLATLFTFLIALAFLRLMGHAGLLVLNKYLELNNEDLQEAHARYSPMDNL